MAHFINDGSMYVFTMLYPILLSNYTLNVLEVSILAGVINLTSIIASPFIGRWSDSSKNYGGLIAAGMLLVGAGIAGFAVGALFLEGYALFLELIPFAGIAGFGSAFYHPLGATVLGNRWKSKNLGRAMGINGSIGSLGRAIYPAIVVALVIAFALPSVLALAIIAIVTGVLVFLLLRGDSTNTGESQKVVKEKSAMPMRIIISALFTLTVVAFIRGVFTVGLVALIPTYLTQVAKMSYGYDLGITIVIMNSMGILGQPFFGWFADKVGRRMALGVSNAGSVMAIVLFLTTSNPILLVVFLAMFGFFTLTAFPIIMSLVSGIVPKEASTTANSIVWGVGNVGGGALGPVLIGLLAEPYLLNSLKSSFYAMAVVGVIAVVLVPFVPKLKKVSQ